MRKFPKVEKYTGKRVRKLFNGSVLSEHNYLGTVTSETAGFVEVEWDEGMHPFSRPRLCSKKELEIVPESVNQISLFEGK